MCARLLNMCSQKYQVRLQTQAAHGVRLNMVQMFSHVIKTDGILGLYKGVCSPRSAAKASLMRTLDICSTASPGHIQYDALRCLRIVKGPHDDHG